MADTTSGQIGAAAVQAMGQYAVTAAANKKQFKYQKEAMALQDQYNRSLWDYQNTYNTPQAQMERLQAAGLNPHLIYGGGSANAGNAGPIQSMDVPTRQATNAQVPDLGARHLMTRQADAQYAATLQNIENAKTKNALTEVQTGLENLKLMREGMRSKNYALLQKAELETQQFIALRSGSLYANEKSKGNLMDQLHSFRAESNPQSVESLKKDNAFKENRNELAKHGIYSTDHPLFRILLQAASRQGIDLGELLTKAPLNYLKDLVK